MSTDIANLAFKADTSDLSDAKAKLDALSPAAGKAQSASSKVMKGFGSLNSSAASLTAAINNLNSNIVKLITNSQKEAQAVNQAASANLKKASSAKAAAAATNQQAAASDKAAAASKRQAAAGGGGGSGKGGNGSGGGSNNVVPIRGGNFNNLQVGNVAAQFQDIGVTAAMGMNPLMIALQQGTQLSSVLSTMESPLKGLANAFKSIISVVSLMTIGLVALTVVGLQMVNWVKVGQTVLNGLADALEYAAPYAVALAAALALIYSRTIIVGIATVGASIIKLAATTVVAGAQMAAAWLLSLGPLGLLIAGVGLVVSAVLIFRDEVSKLIGSDVVQIVKKAGNSIIGAFVGAFNGIKSVWGLLPAAIGDVVIQAVNAVIKGVEDMINSSIEAVNKLADKLPDWVKEKGQTITWRADLGEVDNKFAGSAAKAGEVLQKEMNEALSKDYIGELGKSIEAGASRVASKLRGLAAGLGKEDEDKKGGKTSGEKYSDIVNGAERNIEALKAERDAVGLNEFAALSLKHTTDLLNQARQKGIELTAPQVDQLTQLSESMAALEVETKKAKEALDFSRDATKGFITDMRQGLREGQSLWESFGNAVSRVIDKITDKLLDDLLDAMFEVNGAGGSGFLGSIGGGIADFFGGFFAKGGAFGGGGIQEFAKGGAFSNSVVSSPTLFKFAKGTGLMGEAGPEAIMPLKRGSDGSLGVQMYNQPANDNGGGGTVVNVNIINNSKAQVSSKTTRNGNGTTIDVALDEAVAQNISRPGTATHSALKSMSGNNITKR